MIQYREHGDKKGQVVIYIHGGFTSSVSFQKQFQLLMNYHCAFVDLPGYGKSNEERFSFTYAAELIIDLIDKLSPANKVILIGHSYGGLVVKKLLEKIPDKIDKVVVGSTNLKKTLLFWLYTGPIGCHYLYTHNTQRYKEENITKRLIRDTQRDARRNFYIRKTEGHAIPMLFLYGEYDIKTIKESMNMWHKAYTNSEVIEIKNAGHIYFWENPEVVNPLIVEFLNEKI